MIRSILFDLAEVYIRGMKGAEHEISVATGQEPRTVWHAHLNVGELYELFRGGISEDRYWNAVIAAGNYPAQIAGQDAKKFFKATMRKNFTRIEGTEEVIRKLKAAGYTLGLISDHAREWIEYCEGEFPIREFFDDVCYSFDTGHIKRDDAHNFTCSIESLGADPATTLFIDDNPKNFPGARETGIAHLHHFKNASDLERYLTEQGL